MAVARDLRVKLDQWYGAARGAAHLALERVETGIAFNPLSKDMRVDPYPFYKELRERDPVHRSRNADGWLLSRYEDVSAVLSDRRYSSDERNLRRYPQIRAQRLRAGLPDPYAEGRMSMLRLDSPDHTRLRNLVSKAFTPRAIEALRPRIAEIVDELLSALPAHGDTELIRDFAGPLPVMVIAELLGIPVQDRDHFRRLCDTTVMSIGDGTLEDQRLGEQAMTEIGDYVGAVAEERRRQPQDDLLSALVAAEEDGDALRLPELVATCVLLLVAGNETTTKLIGNSIAALLRHPTQLDLLRDEPKRIEGAIDEFLRFDGPVQLTSRIVLEDGEVAGRRVRRGQQLVLLLAAANRDPAVFEAPDRLDVTREAVRHLSFSYGTHYCLGSQLAKLEGALALEGLITRLPDLHLGDEGIQWGNNTILRGPRSMHLTF